MTDRHVDMLHDDLYGARPFEDDYELEAYPCRTVDPPALGVDAPSVGTYPDHLDCAGATSETP